MANGKRTCMTQRIEKIVRRIMVRWMSGLVTGLQNRLGRFDSATHLKRCKAIIKLYIFFLCVMSFEIYGIPCCFPKIRLFFI